MTNKFSELNNRLKRVNKLTAKLVDVDPDRLNIKEVLNTAAFILNDVAYINQLALQLSQRDPRKVG